MGISNETIKPVSQEAFDEGYARTPYLVSIWGDSFMPLPQCIETILATESGKHMDHALGAKQYLIDNDLWEPKA